MRGGFAVETVEVHAAGEPGRVLTSAADLVEGATTAERLEYCRTHLEWLRRAMLHEPRGHPALCAVLLLPPTTPGADFAMVVLEQGGFTPMSGSNTMCAVTAALETGIVPMAEPVTRVTIDTAVGRVSALARVSGAKVTSVTVSNVPSYVVGLDVPLEVPELGKVPVDVVFGGQFFVQARATDCGVELDPARARDLVRAGALLRRAAREQVDVSHPLNPGVSGVSLVMLHSGDPLPGEEARNTVVLTHGGAGTLDRSPCGTGTCGRMAALHARGLLGIGEDFPHRSIIGSRFVGRLEATTTVAGIPAVVPTVEGQAWVTGRATWQVDPTDPYPEGYTVADLWGP